ncbi:sulfatase-like hydrolase/transferase [Roseibium sp. RKSG952]|uniref:sulfatase-like hydrolase/transferase n=1 Tax=Roseibium sp. RKSG952 TaxID=2529384 RepID=UPI0012BC47D5|nr:sulfatase-like hydrolase/transferase [Roseibium sp. RKSG952]MTI00032.1 hypothetical protein [Roseibium sp. RKSG952]
MQDDKASEDKKPLANDDQQPDGVTRRGILKGGTTAALSIGTLSAPAFAQAQSQSSDKSQPHPASRQSSHDRPYNMILIISDEEAYRLRKATDYSLPAREELMARGTTFHNHYIASAMCTPSRGVMFSGQAPQNNGVYDQMELGYVPSLPADKPSMGTIFKSLGYETAYFGKFELRKDIIHPKTDINYLDALKDYGFDTFAPDGDKVGGPDQAYDTDMYTEGASSRWLRTNAQELNKQGKPWLLVVSFVSPHDIMYADTNGPGQSIQKSEVGMRLTPPPDNTHYQTLWDFPESPTHFEPIDAPGRPKAQEAYRKGWSAFLGTIPVGERQMWYTYYNYYLNLIRDNDRNLKQIIDTVSSLEMWDSTVVIRTADHGELGGSHGGLRGKGPLPYEEETHVPAVIVHPERPGGRNCKALTSHMDLIPTMVGLTNADQKKQANVLRGLPGRDFSGLLNAPDAAPVNAIREGVLFNYVGLQTVDWHYMKYACGYVARQNWVPPFTEHKPDISLRGFVSFVFDGRYKFARYYAPDNFNTPTTVDDLLANNDIELFDLASNPEETINLGMEVDANKDLIVRLNELMNELITREVGNNDGSFLPKALFT